MGDRHGGRFARRGRALSPPRPQVNAHREVGFRWRATAFRCRGVVGRICPAREGSPQQKPPDTARRRKEFARAGTRPSAKASRHGARAKGFARAGTRPSAKASRHGARAKGFAPRRNAPHGEGLPTRRTGERVCPAQERSPRRKPPDTAHERKDLPAQEHAPQRRPPDTAHERKDLPRAGTLPTAKASRHGARAKGFAQRGSRSPHVPTNGGPPSVDGQPKNTPSAGSHPQRAAAAEFIHLKK